MGTDWVTGREAAQILGKSSHWVGLNRALLKIPHYKIGGRYFYCREELQSWIEARHVRFSQASPKTKNRQDRLEIDAFLK